MKKTALGVLIACLSPLLFASNAFADEIVDLPTQEEILRSETELREMSLQKDPFQIQETEAQVLRRYPHIYPSRVVPNDLLKKALLYLNANKNYFQNQKFITIVNFEAPSWEPRMFLIDMKTGAIDSRHVAHGAGGDLDDDGYVEKLSNVVNSHMSSEGFYRVAWIYQSQKFGPSLRIQGLSPTNNKAFERAVVIHGSNYVWDKNVIQGLSFGCFAVSWTNKNEMINLIKDGSLLYAAKSKGK